MNLEARVVDLEHDLEVADERIGRLWGHVSDLEKVVASLSLALEAMGGDKEAIERLDAISSNPESKTYKKLNEAADRVVKRGGLA